MKNSGNFEGSNAFMKWVFEKVPPAVTKWFAEMVEWGQVLPWLALGVDSAEVAREMERLWGSGPEGPRAFRKWIKAFGGSQDEAVAWRRIVDNLEKADSWRGKNFSSETAIEWIEYCGNIGPLEAQKWAVTGFSASEAAPWRAEKFLPEEAWSWSSQSQIPAEQIFGWWGAGAAREISPSIIKGWYIDPFIGNMSLAYEWFCQGFAARDASVWQKSVGSLPNSLEWRSAGFTPSRAAEWIAIDQTGTPSDASEWRSAGLTPSRAAEWIATGIGRRSAVALSELAVPPIDGHRWVELIAQPDLIVEWRKVGATSASEVGGWIERGISSIDAAEWVAAGFLALNANSWIENGLDAKTAREWLPFTSADVAKKWVGTGIIPLQVRVWVELCFSPERALAWVTQGFSEPRDVASLEVAGCTPREATAWTALEVPLQAIERERARWSTEEYKIWSVVGYGNVEIAYQWRNSGVPFDEALAWCELGISPEEGRNHQILGLLPNDIAVVIDIENRERVERAEAIWRFSIDREGCLRDGGVPLFAPMEGCCDREEFEMFLAKITTSRSPSCFIRHGAPYLSRQMIEALPDARPILGSIKTHIWGKSLPIVARFTIADHDAETFQLTATARLNREALFGKVERNG